MKVYLILHLKIHPIPNPLDYCRCYSTFQLDYPNIVNEYKDIKNEIEDVVKKLGIMDRYQIPSEEIAKGVVHMALHGHSGMGSFVNTPTYEGLMSEKDLLDTSLQRRLRNRKSGINYPV